MSFSFHRKGLDGSRIIADDVFCRRTELEADNEVEVGLFILCSRPRAKSCHSSPTITLLSRYTSPSFLVNKTKVREKAVT